jgi:DNA primase
MLPYLRDRPLALARYPDGIGGQRIFPKERTRRRGWRPARVRARPGAAVATPLHWKEVSGPSLEPGRFTLRTIRARLAETTGRHDPWGGLSRRRYSPPRAASRLAEVTG